MKIVKMLPVAMLVALVACESQSSGSSDKAVALESQSQRISYLLGMDNGKNIRGIGLEIDTEAFNRGVSDGLTDQPPALTEEQIAETVKTFEAEMMAKRDEMQQAEEQAFSLQAEGNLKEGQAFLAENGTKEGVVTTARDRKSVV